MILITKEEKLEILKMIERAEIGKNRIDGYITSIMAKRNEDLEFMLELFKKEEI